MKHIYSLITPELRRVNTSLGVAGTLGVLVALLLAHVSIVTILIVLFLVFVAATSLTVPVPEQFIETCEHITEQAMKDHLRKQQAKREAKAERERL